MAYAAEDLYAHGSIDNLSPLSHTKYLDSTSGLQCESATTGDSEVQALDQMVAQVEVESRVTALPSTELYVPGQNTVYEKVDEEMDEMDELDDAGPWPLMTSDLDYPLESETAQVDDGTSGIHNFVYFTLHSPLCPDRKRAGLNRPLRDRGKQLQYFSFSSS